MKFDGILDDLHPWEPYGSYDNWKSARTNGKALADEDWEIYYEETDQKADSNPIVRQ